MLKKNYYKIYIRCNIKKHISYSDNLIKCVLKSKKYINYNTFTAEFESVDRNHIEVPAGMHVNVISNIEIKDGEFVSKRYTPIPNSNDNLELLVKVYRPDKNFPTGGRVSQYLDKIKIGETINIKYPYGKVYYEGNGKFKYKNSNDNKVIHSFSDWKEKVFTNIAIIAGGTGITPIYRILYDSYQRKESSINFFLIFANKSEEDLVLLREIENLKSNINLKTVYVFENPSQNSNLCIPNTETGLITPEHIKKIFPKQMNDLLIMSCGSKVMNNTYVKPMLLDMGYKEEIIFLY